MRSGMAHVRGMAHSFTCHPPTWNEPSCLYSVSINQVAPFKQNPAKLTTELLG